MPCPHRLQQSHILVHRIGSDMARDLLRLYLRVSADDSLVGGQHLTIADQHLARYDQRFDFVTAGGVDEIRDDVVTSVDSGTDRLRTRR
jgi:hypothetical protein